MELREIVIEKLEKAMVLSEAANECKVTLGYGVVEDILALLKAQEPMNAIVVLNGIDRSGGWWYQCPNCEMEIEPRDKYCKSCGQAVSWT